MTIYLQSSYFVVFFQHSYFLLDVMDNCKMCIEILIGKEIGILINTDTNHNVGQTSVDGFDVLYCSIYF